MSKRAPATIANLRLNSSPVFKGKNY